MRIALLLIAAVVTGACSTSGSSERGSYSASSGFGAPPPSEDRTFSCPRSMSDCREQAENYCGEAGYTRVRTPRNIQEDMADAGMPRVGHGRTGRSQQEVRERATIGDDMSRVMTVRCKPPPRED